VPITPDTVVTGVDPFDMTEEAFRDVLIVGGSPSAAHAHDAYGILGTMPVSIAFALAIFHHESQYGKVGITPKYDTKNPGNCRSSRTGVGTIIQTERGPFVKYPNWVEGWHDLAFRLVDQDYVYVEEGRTTIREIITRFAPASDNNVPEAYIAAVVRDMNLWVVEEQPVAGDIPGVEFIPADSRHMTTGRSDPWPTQIIMHHTNGYDSLKWLTTAPASDVSATYLLNHTGTIRAQLVRHEDTPHTTGYKNDDSLSTEWERKWPEQTAISDNQYAEIAYSIAKIYLAERLRGNPFFAGPMTRAHLAGQPGCQPCLPAGPGAGRGRPLAHA
jgi:hypothetical protein